MNKKIYAIMGATGQIGHLIAEQLLKKGHEVRAIGRDQKKLNALKNQGAHVFQLKDFNNEEMLNKAFHGANAVFAFIPPAYLDHNIAAHQDKIGASIASALKHNHIQHVVNLSSIGAQLPEGTGPIKVLHRQELRLNALNNINIVHLRPAYFMENLLWAIPLMKHTGMLRSPLRGDLALPMIATKDIAMKAVELLENLNFHGHTVFEFVGPQPITMNEAAKHLGHALGKNDLRYSQLPYAEAEKQMLAQGMPANTAKLLIEMYRAINDGVWRPTQKLSPEHHARTNLDQFAKVFAAAYKENHEAHRRAA